MVLNKKKNKGRVVGIIGPKIQSPKKVARFKNLCKEPQKKKRWGGNGGPSRDFIGIKKPFIGYK